MTREQKIDAFTMRIDGYTYQEIADKYTVTKQYIQQMLYYICTKSGVIRKRYVYPNIYEWMEQNDVTQFKLAKTLGISQKTISSCLTGKFEPSMKFIKLVLKETGMTFEKAFEKAEHLKSEGGVD